MGLLTLLRKRGAVAFTGALDAVTDDLIEVWYPFRMLTSYEGNLIRLRRVSDDAESDFGYTANGSLDTAAITTWIGASSAKVVKLYGQKGLVDLIAPADANEPAYQATGINSKPALDFDGSASTMRAAQVAIGAFTILFAAKLSGAGQSAFFYDHTDGAGPDDRSYIFTAINHTIQAERGNVTCGRNADAGAGWEVTGLGSDVHVVGHSYDGTVAGMNLWIDNSAQAVTTITSNNPGTGTTTQDLNVGSGRSSNYIDGAYRGIILANTAWDLTTGNGATVYAALADDLGL